MFFNFLAFFFFEMVARLGQKQNLGLKFFFLSFLVSLNPFWIETTLELSFLIFCIFFWNFLARVRQLQNSGLKFFSVFLGLSYPVLAKNNAAKRFFNFFKFFCYFFQNFLARVEYEWDSGLNFFFLSFSAYLIPFCLKIMPHRVF